jgi:hypothetical protein
MPNVSNIVTGNTALPTERYPLSGHTDKVNILGVDYAHQQIPERGDLYVTCFGLPWIEHLHPESWYAKEWFREQRKPLAGTSTIYRTRSRPRNGISKELVVKWCRVGEDVPVDTFTFQKFAQGEFNSPYEEFSLVMEMRNQRNPHTIMTHKPLAIYVPLKKVQLWQTGRSKSKIERKKARYRDVELDIYRQYILIYEWVKGHSAVEVSDAFEMTDEQSEPFLRDLTQAAIRDLATVGFHILNMKPAHIILRPQSDGTVLHGKNKRPVYALVDFELLERTPDREREVLAARRTDYLVRQRDRFGAMPHEEMPPHLQACRIGGIDYIYGHSESTQGEIWVVGRDPSLFDYFQPERWRRTEKKRLSAGNDVYYTRTKDMINLVWKISRVGEPPDIAPDHPRHDAIVQYGYNSPFEEFELAIELSLLGMPTVYPRAIYMSGREAEDSVYALDHSRYEYYRRTLAPDGKPILRHNHTYITIWGYWNGLDEFLACKDDDYCTGIDGDRALHSGLVSSTVYNDLMNKIAYRLELIGFEDLNLKGAHFLLSVTPDGKLMQDSDGLPSIRLCNFALMRRNHQ